MKRSRFFGTGAASLVLAAFTLTSVQTPVFADIVATEQIAAEQQSQAQRDALQGFLSREDVKMQLVERGVDPVAAQQRISSLTATELAAIHEQIDQLPAGEGFGIVIGIIVVFMLLDIAGVTDVFPAL